jgi:lipopolysaccharide/colanic/teichoic acid biosynthesis glycosyltransferase
MKYFKLKRFLDIIFSIVIVFFTLPLIVLIPLIIKLDSCGPIFYRAKRCGLNGRIFYIFKFRTMYDKSDVSKMTTSSNDDRVTRFGFYLRKYKLDELPQFFNVLIGDMSIVGPRPELPFYVSKYSEDEKRILSVEPGITDFASIEYYNLSELIPDDHSNNFFENHILTKKNKLRLKYVDEISLFTDCKIFFFTIVKLIKLIFRK